MTVKRLGFAWSFWRVVAALVFVTGIYAVVVRFSQGLGASTNLSDQFPWGIWIGFDLLVGVALAAGGFTITATVYIFNLERFRPITRPTVLTAFLGYLLVILALICDLGRPDRIWHPLIMWNTHSALFEVAWCVMLYTTVLALEFSPMLLERLRLERPARIIRGLGVPLVIVGVLLSTLHQSSLGTLFVIVPEKLHGLWYTAILPIAFFLSAIAAGLAMVILESYLSARAFGRRLELDLLEALARGIVFMLALYLIVKVQDLVARGAFPLLFVRSPESFLYGVEVLFGVVAPMVLLSVPTVRRDRAGLFCGALLTVLGLILNRLNVAVTGMQGALGQDYFLEPGMEAPYFPSGMEIAVTAFLVLLGCVGFSLAAKYLEVFPKAPVGAEEADEISARRHPWVGYVSKGVLITLAVVLLEGALAFDFGRFGGTQVGPAKLMSAPMNRLTLHLPAALRYPPGDESPGWVEFSHTAHIDEEEPDCAVCHREAFPLVRRAGRAAPRLRLVGEELHETAWCGMCHDGDEAFSVDDDEECESCHFEEPDVEAALPQPRVRWVTFR
jgi:c(7)-type cytochrome triheme protein